MSISINETNTDKSRFLKLAITCDESADTVQVTAATFYRSRQKLDGSDGVTLETAGGSASATACDLILGDTLPSPTVIRLVPTFQA